MLGRLLYNEMVWCKTAEAIYLGAICYFWGFRVTFYWTIIAFMLQFALEVVNYVEHSGLRRKEISPGKYERISVMHSWNAA